MDFSSSELWSIGARRDRDAFYARVREAGEPVLQVEPGSGRRFWLIARYADVLQGLHHPAIGHQVGKHIRPGSRQHDVMRWVPADPVSLGAPLGRLEGRIMFERLPAAFPDLTLAVDPARLRQAQPPRLTELPLQV